MQIREFVSLKKLTTLKIGGVARYFCRVRNEQELKTALQFSKEKEVPVIILGGGSNMLLSEGDINALAVKMDIKGIEWREGKHSMYVVTGAGESWDKLVDRAVKRRLWGIENLSGIPGTAGAAPIQNIGAYGAEIKDTLEWVEVFDTRTGESRRLSNKECEFGYRDSVFKHSRGKSLIVTRVALRLKKSGVPNLTYKDLKQIFNFQFSIFNEKQRKEKPKKLTPLNIRKVVLEIRSRKFPDLKKFGTAGSFFKNPIISKRQFNALKRKYPALPGFEISATNPSLKATSYKLKAIKIPLAWILDNVCGLKGYCKGNVALFERQPIVLVQNGAASAWEIEMFAKEIVTSVREKTGIKIEWEVQRIS